MHAADWLVGTNPQPLTQQAWGPCIASSNNCHRTLTMPKLNPECGTPHDPGLSTLPYIHPHTVVPVVDATLPHRPHQTPPKSPLLPPATHQQCPGRPGTR